MTDYHSKLPWSIAPLDGKYYGTHILDANGEEVCEFWDHSIGGEGNRPSRRERARYKDFKTDDEFEEFWKDYCCDSHYESVHDLANAELIVACINERVRA